MRVLKRGRKAPLIKKIPFSFGRRVRDKGIKSL
jgi:hypothetical protein